MSIDELIDRVRYLRKDEADKAVRAFVRDFIGKDVKGSVLANRMRHRLRERAKKL